MAKIGLNNFRWSKLTEADDGSAEYDGAKKLGKAIECKVSIENNSAELYAEDGLAESDYSFKKGTITLGIDEEDDSIFAKLLGHTIAADGEENAGEVVKKDTDTPPFVGVGRVITKMVNGVYKYKAEFLPKVKFSEPSPEEKTKGENLEFATTSIEGAVHKLSDGTWCKTKTFETKAVAITYVENLMKAKTQAGS